MNILILDGYNLMYRARYSGMNKGEYSTVFNFFRGLRPLIEKTSPDRVFFVLEGVPKKRLELSPDYKGQRKYNNDDNFYEQKKLIISMLEKYFPITIAKHEEYECDDIIGYLANKYSDNEKNKITIISSDTDFIQCIKENISLYNPIRKKYIDASKYDYVLWKSLKGDDSDNIAGFVGIGDKKAQKLCYDKELLDKFLLKEGHRDKLNKNIQMITLHDIKDDANDIVYYNTLEKENWIELKKVFKEYDFNSIISKEKSWNKYKETFNNLWENINVY
jgi:5'-3' exonuclease